MAAVAAVAEVEAVGGSRGENRKTVRLGMIRINIYPILSLNCHVAKRNDDIISKMCITKPLGGVPSDNTIPRFNGMTSSVMASQ